MRGVVSFDLDGTLICPGAPVEPCPWAGRMLRVERLRLGTRRLFDRLAGMGYSSAVYTTSLRLHRDIWLTFRLHGLRLHRIVTGADHRSLPAPWNGSASKVPEAFGFRFHVDDAPISADRRGPDPAVILISPADSDWVDAVLNRTRR